MTTSLANQLNALSVKSRASIQEEVSFGRTSLLFSSSDAAGIDKESVYQLAQDGLADLVEIEKRFADFKLTLFGLDSKNLERNVMSSEANNEIDLLIHEFLILLAPYVQRHCAMKALEWLVQRFHVQKFNSDQLIFTFLPFHEMKLYTRVLQVIDPKVETHKWHWTQEVQKADQVVTKSQLHKFFNAHLEVVNELVNYVIELNKMHSESSCSYYNSFLLTSLIGCIESRAQMKESKLSSLISAIRQCVVSGKNELQKVSIGLMAVIVAKVQLEAGIIHKIFAFFCKHLNENLFDSFLLLLIATQIKQQDFVVDSSLAAKFFLRFQNLTREVAFDNIASECHTFISKLVVAGLSTPKVCKLQFYKNFLAAFLNKLLSEATSIASIEKEIMEYLKVLLANPEVDMGLVDFLAETSASSFQTAVAKLRVNADYKDAVDRLVGGMENMSGHGTGAVLGLLGCDRDSNKTAFDVIKRTSGVESNSAAHYSLVQCLNDESLVLCGDVLEFVIRKKMLVKLETRSFVDALWNKSFDLMFSKCKLKTRKGHENLWKLIANALAILFEQRKQFEPKLHILGCLAKLNVRNELNENEVALILKLAEELLASEQLVKFAYVTVVLLEGQHVTKLSQLETLCDKIISMGAGFEFPQFAGVLKHPNLVGYSSLIEFAFCSPFFKQESVEVAGFDALLTSNQIKLFCFVHILCCLPSKIPQLIEFLGLNSFIQHLLALSLLHKECFTSSDIQKNVHLIIWTVVRTFALKANCTLEPDVYIWPIIIGLSSKKIKVRSLVIEFCQVLQKNSASKSVLGFVLERSQELLADPKQVKLLMQSISEQKGAHLEDLISYLEKNQSEILLSRAMPILADTQDASVVSFLSSTLKSQLSKSDQKLDGATAITIIKSINGSNFEAYLDPVLLALNPKVDTEITKAVVSLLTPKLFHNLKPEAKYEIFSRLIPLRNRGAFIENLKQTIDALPLTTKMLRRCLGLPDYNFNSKTKVRRSRVDSFTSANMSLDKIRMLLDFVCDRTFSESDAREIIVTLNALLLFLERCHMSESTKMDYESAIVSVVGVLKDFVSQFPSNDDVIETDLLLSLIKRFDDVNIKACCFELITLHYQQVCKNLEPDIVNERAIKIFGAICDSLGSREDQFSFRLILSSIKQLLLPLISASKGRPSNIREFLAHFVTSLKVQSAQRQILLIEACIEHPDIDKDTYFWQLILNFFAQSCRSSDVENCLTVVAQVCEGIDIENSLVLMLKLLQACEFFLENKVEHLQTYKLSNLSLLIGKQFRLSAIQMISLIPNVVHSSQFVSKITKARLDKNECCNNLLKEILSQVFKLQNCKMAKSSKSESEQDKKLVNVEFAKTVDLKLKETMAAVDILFDDSLFLEVFTKLLGSSQTIQVRRSLEFLNMRMSRPGSQFLERLNSTDLQNLSHSVLKHILHENDRVCQYVMITVIKLLQVGACRVDVVATKAIQVMDSKANDVNIRVQVCALLTELVKCAKQAFLPYLSRVVLFVLDIDFCRSNQDKLLLDSVLLCVRSLIDCLPDLLGPYLIQIVWFLVELSQFEQEFKLGKELSASIEIIAASNCIVFVPVLTSVSEKVLQSCDATELFLKKLNKFCEIVNIHVGKVSRTDLELSANKWTKLFLKLFEVRSLLFNKIEKSEFSTNVHRTENELDLLTTPGKKRKRTTNSEMTPKKSKPAFKISAHLASFFNCAQFVQSEVKCFEAFLTFILKASEAVVRPVLLKVQETACNDCSNVRRRVTFFHLLQHLSVQLKGLMLLFMPIFMPTVKTQLSLDPTNCENLTIDEILFVNSSLLKCLTNVMSHDINGSFTSSETTNQLLPIIVNQWKFFLDYEEFPEFSSHSVCPCLSQMMLACQDEEVKASIHKQVLSFARDSNPRMRKAVLVAIQSMANRLLEEYSLFYPEAVPVLADLKEDHNPEVEQECDNTLRTIEKVVGEAVYEHFPKIE